MAEQADTKFFDKEWLPKTKFIDRETYTKVFAKYSQVAQVKLTNIYDPPLTLKEIRRMRRNKRKQYRLKDKAKDKLTSRFE